MQQMLIMCCFDKCHNLTSKESCQTHCEYHLACAQKIGADQSLALEILDGKASQIVILKAGARLSIRLMHAPADDSFNFP